MKLYQRLWIWASLPISFWVDMLDAHGDIFVSECLQFILKYYKLLFGLNNLENMWYTCREIQSEEDGYGL